MQGVTGHGPRTTVPGGIASTEMSFQGQVINGSAFVSRPGAGMTIFLIATVQKLFY